MAKTIGIDLGTTNSCMAVLEGGEPTVIPKTPSSNASKSASLPCPDTVAPSRSSTCHSSGVPSGRGNSGGE